MRERARHLIGVAAVLALVAAACGGEAQVGVDDRETGDSGSALTRPIDLPVSIEALETRVIVQADGTAVACREGYEDGSAPANIPLEPRPPICSWEVVILNLDPAELPEKQSSEGVTWTKSPISLVGSFDAVSKVLTLTQPPGLYLPPSPIVNPDQRRQAPCSPLTSGFEEWDPDFIITSPSVRAARAYGAQEPDTFAGAWADPHMYVYTVAFTDDIARHEAALLEIYGGPLCVWQVEHSRIELDEVLAEIQELAVSAGEEGPTILRAEVDEIANRVNVLLWLVDDHAMAPLKHYVEDGILSVTGWIEATG